MKPRPTQKKQQQETVPTALDVSKQDAKDRVEQLGRRIFVRDDDLTQTGFQTHAEAVDAADRLVLPDRNGSRNSEKMRVRVALRSRTGLYDVVVKTPKYVQD